MKFESFSVLPITLALVLGAILQPALHIYNVSHRAIGIVHLYRVKTIAHSAVRAVRSWWASGPRLQPVALLAVALAVCYWSPEVGAGVFLIGNLTPGQANAARSSAGSAYLAQAYLGRNQGPEFFTSIAPTMAAPTQVLIPKNLSLNRPLEAIMLRWRGRVVIAGANYTSAAAESPANLINRITINGTFKGTALTPIKLSGSTAFAWARLFGVRGSSAFISIGGGAITRQQEPSIPYAQTLANLGNTGTYDIDVYYIIPTWPIVGKTARAMDQVPYLWQPQDWADSLQITLEIGDLTSLGVPAGGSTATWTAFGSATGTPVVEIYTRYEILGSARAFPFRTACVIRNESTITSGVTALGTQVRLLPLQKQKTTNIVVKTGVAQVATAGVQVFTTLSDFMLESTQIMVDNKFIRNNRSNFTSKESVGYQFTTVEPQGYLPFSFIDGQSARKAYRADLPEVVGAGSAFELDTDVITAGASQQVATVQEMIFADVDDPFWANTR